MNISYEYKIIIVFQIFFIISIVLLTRLIQDKVNHVIESYTTLKSEDCLDGC